MLETRSYNTNKGDSYCYESPEQKNNQEVKIESDWYSAGMILFNLCGNNNILQMGDIKRGVFPDIDKLRY